MLAFFLDSATVRLKKPNSAKGANLPFLEVPECLNQKVKVDRVWAIKVIIICVSPVVFLGG